MISPPDRTRRGATAGHLLRVNLPTECVCSVAAVAFEQLAQGIVIGDIGRPAVGLRNRSDQHRMSICEPCGPVFQGSSAPGS